MSLNKHKKLEYVKQILEEIANGSVDTKEDSILIEVAIDFINDIQGEGDTKN
jgi:dihydropteroate synthase